MAFINGNKSIVTDGLVFCMDPVNKQSWTGPNSCTVYDIIGTNTGTIYGGTSVSSFVEIFCSWDDLIILSSISVIFLT